ncbi:hypothetical protein CMI46_00190 [Candidatus Pacearchaeota archaeon]|nr:hypothetical protein [Candidatus Pacearchaeota archaeon]|tara:strand:+ start:218 stop:415 length:198 start_codon:yes stop_codon:yes gene_type:complete
MITIAIRIIIRKDLFSISFSEREVIYKFNWVVIGWFRIFNTELHKHLNIKIVFGKYERFFFEEFD